MKLAFFFAFAEVAESESSVMSCRSDESARRADARSTTRIEGVVSDVVGAKVSCSASTAVHRIDMSSSEAYFGSAIRCDVARVCKLDPASFAAAMEKRGFYGWDLVDGVVVGESTSRSYRSCDALPRGETACRDGATNTAWLEGLIWASLGSRARCTGHLDARGRVVRRAHGELRLERLPALREHRRRHADLARLFELRGRVGGRRLIHANTGHGVGLGPACQLS